MVNRAIRETSDGIVQTRHGHIGADNCTDNPDIDSHLTHAGKRRLNSDIDVEFVDSLAPGQPGTLPTPRGGNVPGASFTVAAGLLA